MSPPKPEEVEEYVKREMSPWTPGPWQVEEHMPGGYAVRSPDGVVAGIIAFRGDANLTALAPEMAEALADLLARVDGPWADSENSESGNAVRTARALLARARGETP